MTDTATALDPERVALLEALAQQRYFLLHTVEGLSDEQARLTPTASELCLGGIVKHVALTERGWTDFVEHGAMAGGDDADYDARAREFRLLEDETLEGVVALYREVAAHTDELIRTCMRHQRTVLVEMARGREATLDVVHLCNEAGGGPEVVAVLGTSAAESGEREQEQLIARTGPGQFVLYNYPSAMGAEPRVKRAVHGKPTKALTEAHVAAMRAEPHAGSVKH